MDPDWMNTLPVWVSFKCNNTAACKHTSSNLHILLYAANSFPYGMFITLAASFTLEFDSISLFATLTAHRKLRCNFWSSVSNKPPDNRETMFTIRVMQIREKMCKPSV